MYFNPTCEMAVRQDGMNYTPPKALTKMEMDLAPLMAFLSKNDDKIVGVEPDNKILETLKRRGKGTNFIDVAEARRLLTVGEKLRPWGWSRATLAEFGMKKLAKEWKWRDLLSRRTSVLVEEIVERKLGGENVAAAIATTEVGTVRDYLLQGDVVIKSLWSASGRGVRFYGQNEEAMAVEYAEKCIEADGAVVVERKLERVSELSFLFSVGDSGVEYKGANAYRSGDGGAFGCEIIGLEAFDEIGSVCECWEKKYGKALCDALEEVLKDTGYRGAVGVDAMVYKGDDGKHGIRCCMEVNVRYCMGHVANEVKKMMADGAHGHWRIEKFGADGEWDAYCDKMSREKPLEVDEEGRIRSGFFRLTGLGANVRFGACGEVWK